MSREARPTRVVLVAQRRLIGQAITAADLKPVWAARDSGVRRGRTVSLGASAPPGRRGGTSHEAARENLEQQLADLRARRAGAPG